MSQLETLITSLIDRASELTQVQKCQIIQSLFPNQSVQVIQTNSLGEDEVYQLAIFMNRPKLIPSKELYEWLRISKNNWLAKYDPDSSTYDETAPRRVRLSDTDRGAIYYFEHEVLAWLEVRAQMTK